jgi:hypothetical protein
MEFYDWLTKKFYIYIIRTGISTDTEFCYVLTKVLNRKQKTEQHNFAVPGLNLLNETRFKCQPVPTFCYQPTQTDSILL